MAVLVPIVEGPGDVKAAPELIRRILHEHFEIFDWKVARPKQTGGLEQLKKRLPNFLTLAEQEPGCAGILILLDLDEGCPKSAACNLAEKIKTCYRTVPVAVVLAHREFEAWFLASADSLAGLNELPSDLSFSGNPENVRGAKEWFTNHMPPGITYKETIHQVRWAAQIDLSRAEMNSRSFRRLISALAFILNAKSQTSEISPERCDL